MCVSFASSFSHTRKAKFLLKAWRVAKKRPMLHGPMRERGAASMFNFLQTADLIHLRPGQRTASSEVPHRIERLRGGNALQRELLRVEESRQSEAGKGKEETTS